MKRAPITSKTGMCGVAYDQATETLELAFSPRKAGEKEKVYQYTPFTPEDWSQFQAAQSKGSHFLKFIRPCFRCTRIEEKDAEDKAQDRKAFDTETPDENLPF